MILRAATNRNAPRNAIMDHMIRAFDLMYELYISTYEKRNAMLKKVDLYDIVDEREEWIDKELEENPNKHLDRDGLLAYSFPTFMERTAKVGKKYKDMANKSMEEIVKSASDFKQFMMDNVSTVIYGTNFECIMNDIRIMCRRHGKTLNPMLGDKVKDARYEMKLAVAWTMQLCWRIIERFYVKQRQSVFMVEVFEQELGKVGPFCVDSREKTWEEMQDTMIKVAFDVICMGPFEASISL
jgi:hypothetical protein